MIIDRRSLTFGLGAFAVGCDPWITSTPASAALDIAAPRKRGNTASVPHPGDALLSFRGATANVGVELAAYRPSRIEWHYVEKPERVNLPGELPRFVARLKQRFDIKFVGGAINANPPGLSASAYAQGIDGSPLVAPWMRASGRRWATTASAETRAFLLSWADRTLDAGCDGIQIDDGGFQWAAETWGGGDFSPESLAGFGPWLASNFAPARLAALGVPSTVNFDYRRWIGDVRGRIDVEDYLANRESLLLSNLWRTYQASSVIEFWRMMRAYLNQRSPRIPLSTNFGRVQPSIALNALAPFLDYTVSEVQAVDPPWRMALAGATAEAMALPFAGCYSGEAPRAALRQSIANCHASGIIPVAPWDGYVAGPNGTFGKRFSPPPTDYADLFDFARDHAALLDGWVGGGTLGVVIPLSAYPDAATNSLIIAMVAANVPFRLIGVGGDIAPGRPTREDFAGLSAVIVGNPGALRINAVPKAIAVSRLPLVDAASLPRWSAGGFEGRTDWRLSVRHRPTARGTTIVHIVANTLESQPLSGRLVLHAGTPFRFERTPQRRLLRPGHAPVVLSPQRRVDGAVVYDLPMIEAWAMLADV